MITKIIRQRVEVEYDEWETEEFEFQVLCPECDSTEVYFADEKQPCDGTNLYDGLTYSVICSECGHLFYQYEDLETELYGG